MSRAKGDEREMFESIQAMNQLDSYMRTKGKTDQVL
jgi:hypothetical protein